MVSVFERGVVHASKKGGARATLVQNTRDGRVESDTVVAVAQAPGQLSLTGGACRKRVANRCAPSLLQHMRMH